ncbi:MAG TPA: PP2C family protein-serine/threonine phosphatase [Solirubrobacterales bacterium]|nr:PP2C family protein-serine/threonine phosphatase [Solirubrobacterales bacterium]
MPSSGHSSVARIAWIAVLALVVFVVWLLVNQTGGGGIGFFYAIPIGLATWWFGLRAGVVTALACLALYVIGALIEPVTNVGVALAIRALAFAGVVGVVSILRERLLVLEQEVEELEDIRAALTPTSLPDLPDVEAGAAFAPSDHGVSGDFYLLTNGPDGSTVAVVGDVVGHGPRAARVATFIRARLAAFAANTSEPAQILELANGALLERPDREDRIVSAICLRYEPDGSTLSWAVAGHPPPLRLPDLAELRHQGPTLLLGIEPRLELEATTIPLGPAEGVLVYTDGATDVRRGRNLLGREGLARLLTPHAHLPSHRLAREAHRAVLEWTDAPLGDDLCLVVLRPKSS